MDDFKIACHYCGGYYFFGELTKDHVIPQSAGGRDIVENVVPSCSQCNQAKADKMPECDCAFCLRAVEYYETQYINVGIPVLRKRWSSSSRGYNEPRVEILSEKISEISIGVGDK